MNKYFTDTNIFLRFFTNDVPEQAEAVEHLLNQATEGQVVLQTSALVIAEIVWTLESYYELSREEIKSKILAILNTPGLLVENSDIISQAIPLYVDKNIDFIDAYNSYWMRAHGLSRVYTFDIRHFARAAGITPLVPGND